MITVEEKYFGYDLSVTRHTPVNLTYPDHLHRSFELIFVQNGEITITIDEQSYLGKSGDLFFIFPFQIHSFETILASKISLVIFPPEYIYDFYSSNKNQIFTSPFIRPSVDDFIELYQNLFEKNSFVALKYSFYKILFLFEKSETLIYSKKEEGITVQILNYIENNLSESINIASLSQSIGYSTSFVSKYIAKQLNSTFPKLVNQARIHHSCFLLTNSNLSITDLSDQSGFQNVRTFNRNFSKEMGTSPTDYRKSQMTF